MADNIDITPGSGKTVATNEESIGGSTVHVQRQKLDGAASFDADQNAAIGTTATTATIAARDTRHSITIMNIGSVTVYVSDSATNAGSPATSTDNSFPLAAGLSVTLITKADIYVFTGAGTGNIAWWEEFS